MKLYACSDKSDKKISFLEFSFFVEAFWELVFVQNILAGLYQVESSFYLSFSTVFAFCLNWILCHINTAFCRYFDINENKLFGPPTFYFILTYICTWIKDALTGLRSVWCEMKLVKHLNFDFVSFFWSRGTFPTVCISCNKVLHFYGPDFEA